MQSPADSLHGSRNFERYLDLLGVRRKPPSISALTEVVRAQMLRVPFETISKLYRLKTSGLRGIPPFDEYLEGVGQFHFGGTCYSNNYFFNQLLNHLGYDVKLCGADMSRPDVHIVSIVKVERREFLVDVGYGAPFLAPLPCDVDEDVIIASGHDRYVLKPRDKEGRSRLELFRDGSLRHGYCVNPRPRTIDEFDQVIAGSFRREATFMNAILLTRFTTDRSFIIHNMAYMENCGNSLKRAEIPTRSLLSDTIERVFGIPKPITETALGDLALSGDAWG